MLIESIYCRNSTGCTYMCYHMNIVISNLSNNQFCKIDIKNVDFAKSTYFISWFCKIEISNCQLEKSTNTPAMNTFTNMT